MISEQLFSNQENNTNNKLALAMCQLVAIRNTFTKFIKQWYQKNTQNLKNCSQIS